MLRMRNLAFALSVGLLGLAAGCESAAVGGSGQIQLTWSLQDQATGQAISCAAGEQVHVTSGGVTDIFNCTAMAGITDLIASGDYAVRIDLVLNNTVEWTVTMPSVPVRNRSITDIGHILFIVAASPPPPGAVHFTWEIRVNGNPAPCRANEFVRFDFGGGLVFDNVACAPMAADLTQVPAGTYAAGVTAQLLMGGTVESQGRTTAITVPSGATVDGGHIIFNV